MKKRYSVARLDEISAVPCYCGSARRAFTDPENTVATLHLVEVKQDANAHYHKQHTEIYYILEGEGFLELDGDRVPVRPGTAVLIPPGVKHRAVGKIRLLNIPIPAFDPQDEYLD